MNKTGLIVFISFFLMFRCVLAAQEGEGARVVKVGVYQNPPKCFVDESGEPAGVFVDLIRAIADEEGWALEFVRGSWMEGLRRVQSGEIDLMPDVAHSPLREDLYAFHAEPVLSDWFQIYARAGADVKSITDLENRRVAVLENSVQFDTFTRMVKEGGFACSIVGFPNYELAFAMVEDGSVDAVIVNRFYGRMRSRENPGLEETGIIFHPTRLHFAGTRGGDGALLAAIDRHLRRWKHRPGSIYYRSLLKWTGEKPPTALPKYAWAVALGLVAALALALAFVALLRWRVRTRTAELRVRTEELEKALDDLKSASLKMQQQERLHAMGQMASGISHDFNNVLMPILGYVEILLDAAVPVDSQETRQALESIRDAAMTGADMVKRMKTFYRVQSEERQPAPVALTALVTSTLEMTRPRWEVESRFKGIHLDIRARLEPPREVLGHVNQLREVLVNVLFNAIDALPRGGVITVAVEDAGEFVKLSVKDDGEGMPAEVLANCRRPFYSTKGESGTGMGLAMAANVLEAHGGKLEIRSSPGQGTEVSLLLPQAPA